MFELKSNLNQSFLIINFKIKHKLVIVVSTILVFKTVLLKSKISEWNETTKENDQSKVESLKSSNYSK